MKFKALEEKADLGGCEQGQSKRLSSDSTTKKGSVYFPYYRNFLHITVPFLNEHPRPDAAEYDCHGHITLVSK